MFYKTEPVLEIDKKIEKKVTPYTPKLLQHFEFSSIYILLCHYPRLVSFKNSLQILPEIVSC